MRNCLNCKGLVETLEGENFAEGRCRCAVSRIVWLVALREELRNGIKLMRDAECKEGALYAYYDGYTDGVEYSLRRAEESAATEKLTQEAVDDEH